MKLNSEMRILILTPTALPSITGNAITAERWRRSLQRKGVSAVVLAAQEMNTTDLLFELESFKPNLIHIHHASRAGSLLLDYRVMPIALRLPLVVSPGGTDINIDLDIEDRKQIVTRVYEMARIIISQSRETSKQIRTLFPGFQKQIALVPKSFSWSGHDVFDLRKIARCQNEDILFFLPAGIRPVKGTLECLMAFERLHAVPPSTKIVFAGPALHLQYTARFEEELKRFHPFAHWIPYIPPVAMHSAYETSDIALNFSFSEGLSNALLEAIAVGRPVLASNIPGNWWPVLGENGDRPAGYLFDTSDPEDFIHHALRLIDDKKIREAFGRTGQERASRWPTPEMEADGLIQTYRTALGT
jgi:glycosyltransferase involved in cell wall biosynthesis